MSRLKIRGIRFSLKEVHVWNDYIAYMPKKKIKITRPTHNLICECRICVPSLTRRKRQLKDMGGK